MSQAQHDPEDPWMRFRVWVEGHLMDETWVDTSSPDAQRRVDDASARHRAIVDNAETQGYRWLVESYDPARLEDEAYMRIGTDTDGMVLPMQASLN